MAAANFPAGTPVSQALAVPAGQTGDPFRLVLRAIDRVHADGALPGMTLRREPLLPGRQGYFDPSADEIVIAIDARHPVLTTLHEIGHVLDLYGLGEGHRLASVADPLLDHWRDAVEASDAHRSLTSVRLTSGHSHAVAVATYLLLQEELWARS